MYKFEKTLYDLGAHIKLVPYTMFQKLGLIDPIPTTMRLLMEDHLIKKLIGVLYDVLVKVYWFILPVDFVILDCKINHEIPIILCRPLSAIGIDVVDMEYREMKFWVNNKEVFFSMCKTKKQPMELQVVSVINVVDEKVTNAIEVVIGSLQVKDTN